jgi:membrane associated rhomboid family serine protease
MEPPHPIVDSVQASPSFKRAFAVAAAFVSLLWLIRFADAGLGLHLVRFGVYPGVLDGLPGILFAPLIHGSWLHLIANTPALLVLGTALLYGYPRSAGIAVPILCLGSGLGVWLFARESYHIGASGLTHGMMFFIFVIGILRRDRSAIALSLLVFFLYGGMVWSVLPQQPGISFESHFFGAVTGVTLAFLLRNRDAKRPEKRYDWEDEPETGDDSFIDDQGKN